MPPVEVLVPVGHERVVGGRAGRKAHRYELALRRGFEFHAADGGGQAARQRDALAAAAPAYCRLRRVAVEDRALAGVADADVRLVRRAELVPRQRADESPPGGPAVRQPAPSRTRASSSGRASAATHPGGRRSRTIAGGRRAARPARPTAGGTRTAGRRGRRASRRRRARSSTPRGWPRMARRNAVSSSVSGADMVAPGRGR